MVSKSYFPFGLGRWACPGRNLAIAGVFHFTAADADVTNYFIEIKMIVWSILLQGTPILRNGCYIVRDPLNVTSVAPKGEVTLLPLKCNSST